MIGRSPLDQGAKDASGSERISPAASAAVRRALPNNVLARLRSDAVVSGGRRRHAGAAPIAGQAFPASTEPLGPLADRPGAGPVVQKLGPAVAARPPVGPEAVAAVHRRDHV